MQSSSEMDSAATFISFSSKSSIEKTPAPAILMNLRSKLLILKSNQVNPIPAAILFCYIYIYIIFVSFILQLQYKSPPLLKF